MPEARIDKWMWAARIFKTRTIAAEACKKGRISINGSQVKPARMVKPGDVVQVRKPPVTYSFKVLQAIEKRVGAKLVPEIMENVTTPDQYELLEMRDGLHQAAGSRTVWELHGSIHRNYCMECGRFYEAQYVKHADGVPRCECGGLIKPDVVLYEEGLDQNVIRGAVEAIAAADTLIIGGTSLVVYPAAGFIDYFRGKHLVVINKSSTARSVRAELSISAPIGEVMSGLHV